MLFCTLSCLEQVNSPVTCAKIHAEQVEWRGCVMGNSLMPQGPCNRPNRIWSRALGAGFTMLHTSWWKNKLCASFVHASRKLRENSSNPQTISLHHLKTKLLCASFTRAYKISAKPVRASACKLILKGRAQAPDVLAQGWRKGFAQAGIISIQL